ncbi:septum formation initiator family protein [Nonomuraea longicatena]|uniref:Septum formation initiator family protein n=1 Tax=Nonomuraea longicatena TaxID=83682 RepID=A0ABP4AT18_9ACTN
MAKRPQLTGRAAILAVVVCAIAMSLAYPVREYISQRRNIAELEAEKSRVQTEAQVLAERAKQMADPHHATQVGRERLHFCSPGMKCLVIAQPRPRDKKAPAVQPGAQSPWYQTLWESVEAADTGKGMKALTGEKSGK